MTRRRKKHRPEEIVAKLSDAAASISRTGPASQMSPDTAVFASDTIRTSLRTMRLNLGFDLFGRHRRRSDCSELLPSHLHLREAGYREPFAGNRVNQAGFGYAFGRSLLGEGIENRESLPTLSNSHHSGVPKW